MPLEIVTIPCLKDNYAYLIHNSETGETALVDIPEAAPIEAVLAQKGWTLTDVLITHHHWDHIDGLEALSVGKARIIGAKADAHRLPPLTLAVEDSSVLTICGESVQILDVSGHTIGHIAFYFRKTGAIFTADSLMVMGCGRLFEGSPEMMLGSMEKFAKMPDTTLLYSGHEYTAHNANFAQTVDPENTALITRITEISAARDAGLPTIPSTLGQERATNPFLRYEDAHIRATLNLQEASNVEVFAELRTRRNGF
ncbi:hydroxyacylglutathione hydrolase [Falsihalocynthiibacter sp. S25ZX9]|uniref:hydroxyacylglutathione hydrolase n=1 Tax=Falsihalocynthiibacter sp. S25ZX9 TaxID=3240870 RepID=UPI00350F4047